jgi:hypothetical protein
MDVQGHLCRLAHGPAEDAEHGDVEELRVGDAADGLGDLVEVDRAGEDPDQENPRHEAEVTDAVDKEGLLGGVRGRGLLIPVANEEVGTDPHEFPEDEHHHEVVGEDDAGHGEEEEGEAREVARLALVLLHVAEGEEVDEEADEADDEHHAPAEAVEFQADADFQSGPEIDPGVGLGLHGSLPAAGQDETEQQHEQGGGGGEQGGRSRPAFQAEQDRRRNEQRQEEG